MIIENKITEFFRIINEFNNNFDVVLDKIFFCHRLMVPADAIVTVKVKYQKLK